MKEEEIQQKKNWQLESEPAVSVSVSVRVVLLRQLEQLKFGQWASSDCSPSVS